jgi:hypothetical protein
MASEQKNEGSFFLDIYYQKYIIQRQKFGVLFELVVYRNCIKVINDSKKIYIDRIFEFRGKMMKIVAIECFTFTSKGKVK